MKILLDSKTLQKTILKMAEDILKDVGAKDSLVLVGMTTRGVPLATRLAAQLHKKFKKEIPVGVLDITLYRDDLSRLDYHPQIKRTEITFSLDSKIVYLVDDVLYTGRTVRCALDALFDLGRPDRIALAVLVDRTGRELPIQADVVGIHYDAALTENVKVKLKESDGDDRVEVVKQ